jgi:hypothetical protein
MLVAAIYRSPYAQEREQMNKEGLAVASHDGVERRRIVWSEGVRQIIGFDAPRMQTTALVILVRPVGALPCGPIGS